MVDIDKKFKKIYTSGKRKSSIARALIKAGNGKVLINGKNYKTLHMFDRLKIAEPLRITEEILGKIEFDFEVNIKGGGDKSQIDAARIAITKAILEFTQSEELKKEFLAYDRNLLIADVRRKEMCKPGDSKARAKRQSSKR
ncbi:MAG: 30S ribosomal protein S9 [Nanoarchaeota archaeon]|nr:30S ribosomal protein S9 [Nanoarchaeota archaeon]